MKPRLEGLGAWVLYGLAALVVTFILAPLVVPALMSVSNTFYVKFPPEGFTLRWYAKVLTDEEFLTAFLFSLKLAAVVTLIVLVIGTFAAVGLVRHQFPGRGLVQGLVLSPLIFPVLVTGVALLQFFSRLGSGEAFLHLVVGHVVICVPYVVRTVSASLMMADRNIEDAARTLGAGPWRTFWRVTRYQIQPGLLAGAVFCFIISFDDFPVAMWLADAANFTLPLQIFVFIERYFDPGMAAIATLMILFAVLLLVLTELILGVSIKKLVGVEAA